jgi:hypothetical protein
LCKQAGLVKVGVIAIDGTKIHANASHHCNLDYEQLAKEILKEAGDIDAAEDVPRPAERHRPRACEQIDAHQARVAVDRWAL